MGNRVTRRTAATGSRQLRRRAAAWLSVALLATTVGVGAVTVGPAEALPVTFRAEPLASDQLDGEGLAIAQLGTTVYVGGIFANVRSQAGTPLAARANLAAFDVRTGAFLAAFRADTNGPVRALTTDGRRIFAGGSFTTVNGASRSRVVALDPTTGAVDPAFRADTNSNVYAIASYTGHVVVGGSFSHIGGVDRSRFAVLSSTTGAVSSIAPSFDATLASVGATSDGSTLIAGGAFTHVNGASLRWGALIDGTTGAPRSTQLTNVNGPLSAIAVNPDDATFVASMTGAGNSGNRYRLSDGHRLWAQYCDGDGQAIEEFAGTVYSGFHEGCSGDLTIRLTANDSLLGVRDPLFRPSFDKFWGARALDASGTALALAGDFTLVSGVHVQGFALFPSILAPPPPTTTAPPTTTTTTVAPTTTTTTTAPPPTTTTTAPPANAGFPFAVHSAWRYDDGTAVPPSTWNTVGFADGGWQSGNGQLGYGDGDEATVLGYGPDARNKTITSYFRRSFTLGTVPSSLRLQLVADDGAVVYLNGVEVLRDNMPGGTITAATLAAANRGGANESNPRTFTVPASALRVGQNVVAVEVHQDAANTSDLSFDLAMAPA